MAVAMSIPVYICMESAETISPSRALASLTASADLPDAVGPTTAKIFSGFSNSNHSLPNNFSMSFLVCSMTIGLPWGQYLTMS